MEVNIGELLQQIGHDMMEPVRYLPFGILVGVIFLFIMKFWGKIEDRRVVCSLLVVYGVVLFNLTLFSREPGSRAGLDLKPFGSLNASAVSQAFFIENIMLFVPLGVLLPMVISVMRSGWKCILTGFLLSFFLELIQLIAGMGFCQVDDVMTNTVGTAIGWGVFRLFARCRKLE